MRITKDKLGDSVAHALDLSSKSIKAKYEAMKAICFDCYKSQRMRQSLMRVMVKNSVDSAGLGKRFNSDPEMRLTYKG